MAKGIKLRDWALDVRDYETEDDFRAAVVDELARFEHIGERFGIGLVAAPVKQRLESGAFVTVGWTFQTATVPAVGTRAVPVPVTVAPEVDDVLEDEDEPEEFPDPALAVAAPTVDPYAEPED